MIFLATVCQLRVHAEIKNKAFQIFKKAADAKIYYSAAFLFVPSLMVPL